MTTISEIILLFLAFVFFTMCLFDLRDAHSETYTIGIVLTVNNAAVFGLDKAGMPILDAMSDCRIEFDGDLVLKNC